MREKMRSRIAGQSAPTVFISTPNRAASSGARASAEGLTNILVGMQPTFRQVPPKAPVASMP